MDDEAERVKIRALVGAMKRWNKAMADVRFDQSVASPPDIATHVDKALDAKGITDTAERGQWRAALLRLAKVPRYPSSPR